MGNHTLQLMKSAHEAGFGDLDMSAIVEQFRHHDKPAKN
jgi:hypothetical protein